MLSAADQTLVVTSYGVIGSDLNALNNTSWIATAYESLLLLNINLLKGVQIFLDIDELSAFVW